MKSGLSRITHVILFFLILMSAMRANLDVGIQINEQRHRGNIR